MTIFCVFFLAGITNFQKREMREKEFCTVVTTTPARPCDVKPLLSLRERREKERDPVECEE
jgi:hypothetical protein